MLHDYIDLITRTDIIVALVTIGFLAAAWWRPLIANRFYSAIERAGAQLAERNGAAIATLAAATIIIRVALLPLIPAPTPHVHDEFSYLLAADTFVHGHLTNPAHPMRLFLDTFHVNAEPTYMSKYPPAQGAVLALGTLLGNPWIGVLLSMAGLSAAALWMMQGWLPPRWALVGGVLVLLRLGTFSYWVDSYWGGAVAAIGGALVMGAVPRILRGPRLAHALLLGLGATILGNSRPFEGAILCLPVAALLLAWILGRRSPPLRVTLVRLILPFGALAVLCGIFVGYYNWRVTGSALLSPYEVNERTYISTPTFFWDKPRPPLHFANPQFEEFYNCRAADLWQDGRVDGVVSAAKHLFWIAVKYGKFLLWPELCVPFLALLPWLWRDTRMRFPSVVVGVCLLGFVLVPWVQPHYAAPVAVTLFLLVTQGMRHLRHWRFRGSPVGIGLTRVVVLLAILPAPFHTRATSFAKKWPYGVEFRPQVQSLLDSLPGEHLVVVRYNEDHEVDHEWVYNRADIDHAKVVWARDIAGVDPTPLLQYFQAGHGRSLWLLDADDTMPKLFRCADNLNSCRLDERGPVPGPRRLGIAISR